MSRLLAFINSKSRGQAMVEFSLVAPIFFLLLFGVIEGGRLVFTYHEVNHAAREGVRFAAAQGIHSGNVSTAEPVEDHVRQATSGIDWDRAVLDARWPGGDGCDDATNGPGCPVEVEVTYEFEPIVAMIFGSGSITLESTSEMKIHY